MWRTILMLIPLSLLLTCSSIAAEPTKTAGALYPPELLRQARENAAKYPWAAEIRDQIVTAAQPWMKLSDDELWDLMFGNTIKRAWQVWSDGYCPSCKEGVPMYNWVHQPLEHPWKVQCPHCKELFPKNDFQKFYRSGLDEHGVFDPKRADRSLLVNAEHPDPADHLHKFGVDDGEGYVADGHRWRFIGAYLIYGQWKRAIVAGATNCAAAYAITGDKTYSHKAGILLDRIADLYPTFDFGKEGVMYEGAPLTGYVSTWHDACWEAKELATAYDQAFEGIKDDPDLVRFLSTKAKQYNLENPKAGFADIQRNIEDRIFRDTITHRDKIRSNYPQTDLTLATIKTVLGWPGNREEVMGILGDVIQKSTAVDGLTGEKGLTGYSALSPIALGQVLGQYSRVDRDFLKDVLRRYPAIHDSYRFHIDTWCFGEYYPFSGDCGAFARKAETYQGLALSKSPGLNASMFTFLKQLYEFTGDAAFVQVLYKGNGGKLDGLPHDLFAENPEAFQADVKSLIKRHGTDPKVGSVNKQQWHLAILRSGSGKGQRAMWLDYDSGGPHGHKDGMNLGLFAKGLDLMPDFGYPPVHYGGWESPRSVWYTMTAAHNTVVVDSVNQVKADGKTTLWADGNEFRAIRASAPGLIEGAKQYERTAAMVDTSESDSYLVDIFRVVGGTDHAKMQHSHFGSISTEGLHLSAAPDYNPNVQMRAFQVDPSPKPGWSADWKIEDRHKFREPGAGIHLRYTDLTTGAAAYTAEKWVSVARFDSNEDAWIPCLMVRRISQQAPLASTFVSVVEPYEKRSGIRGMRRLPLETLGGVPYPDSHVAVEVSLASGRTDLFAAADVENPLHTEPVFHPSNALVQKDWGLRLQGEMCLVRRDSDGTIQRIALCRGQSLSVGNVVLKLKKQVDFIEIEFEDGKARVVSGDAGAIEEMTVNGISAAHTP